MTITIAGFAGSLRAGSYNAALLREAVSRAPEGLEIAVVDISGFPLYDADLEVRAYPGTVLAAKRAVDEADGVLLATPEYNYGIPGVMKNAVDWLSRPYGDGTLTGKPAAFMGASPGYAGTMRAQLALRQMWHYFDAPVFSGKELHVSSARDAFDGEGRLVSDFFERQLDMFLITLRDWLVQVSDRD